MANLNVLSEKPETTSSWTSKLSLIPSLQSFIDKMDNFQKKGCRDMKSQRTSYVVVSSCCKLAPT